MFQYHLYVRPSESGRLMETIYEYWMKKRETDEKPLMRRYWPITNVAGETGALLYAFLSLSLSLSFFLSVCLSICLSICLSV